MHTVFPHPTLSEMMHEACSMPMAMQKAGARPAFRRSVNRRPARQLVTLSPDGRTMAVEPTGTRL
jgi:hypothetical protein